MRHLIVDGLNFFIRSFTVNPSMDSNGDHVGGMLGFLVGLNKLVRENEPDRVLIVWDGEGGSWKRRSLYGDYKSGRKPKLNRQYDFESPDESLKSMKTQLLKLQRYLEYVPVSSINVKGVEADDVIAYLWRFMIPADDEKIIVSSDRDFYQLLDSKTTIYTPTKKEFYSSSDMHEELGVMPENYIFMKALMGDKSDNVKGLRGIGPKTVVKLFPFLADRVVELEDIFRHCEENEKENGKYGTILEKRKLVIDNVSLMQLSSPLMDPGAARSIRSQFDGMRPQYRPTDMKMQLMRDGLQIKASDFFVVFKEQMHRHEKTLT